VLKALASVVTFGSLAMAAVVSVAWFVAMPGEARLEPAAVTLGLIGGLAGVFAERRAARRELRNRLLQSIAGEISKAAGILDDPRFDGSDGRGARPHVFPRLPASAVDAALASGALADRQDAALVELLHEWRDDVNDLNRRLDITELRIFTASSPAEVRAFEHLLHGADGPLGRRRQCLQQLQDRLIKHHLSAYRRRSAAGTAPGGCQRQQEALVSDLKRAPRPGLVLARATLTRPEGSGDADGPARIA
jgi:hypothetical protein